MSDESSARIDRIKKILGLESDKELADKCETFHPRVSNWRHKGFPESTEKLLDILMDQYDMDKRPKRGRPPKLSIGQRIRKARMERKLSQWEFGLMVYSDEDINANTSQVRIRRLEKKEGIDAETLNRVAKALGMAVDEL